MRTARQYAVIAGQLQRNAKWVAKMSEREEIYQSFHMHSGRDKTHLKIRDRFYWYGGEKYVRQKVKECVPCSHKTNRAWKSTIAPLQPILVTPKTMFRIHLDLAGPFKKSQTGNKYIALAVDAFTKYVEGQGNKTLL